MFTLFFLFSIVINKLSRQKTIKNCFYKNIAFCLKPLMLKLGVMDYYFYFGIFKKCFYFRKKMKTFCVIIHSYTFDFDLTNSSLFVKSEYVYDNSFLSIRNLHQTNITIIRLINTFEGLDISGFYIETYNWLFFVVITSYFYIFQRFYIKPFHLIYHRP